MTGSLMIRKQDGYICGYILEKKGVFTICMKGHGEQGRIVIRRRDGTQREYDICCDGHEHALQEELEASEELEDGYIVLDDRVKAYFGQKRWEVCVEELHMKTEGHSAESKKDTLLGQRDEKKGQICEAKQGVEQERRWPPPPCWPDARYEHGKWRG